jgi:hypothetical protein
MATDPTMMEPADDDMASLEREEPAEMSDVDDDELSEDTIEDQTDNQATVTPTDPITTPQNQQEDLPRRSARVPKYNARYEEFRKSIGLTALIEDFKSRHSAALFTESFEPQSYKDALNSKDADKWMLAFKEEYDSLIENQTWRLVLPPPGCSPINCKWIGKVKPAYDTVPERYKGRLVAIGTKQRFGIDYDEVFSPVPHQEAVKAAFCEIASRDLEVIQFDIKTAFLYATLDKPIFMRQPEGFITKGKENHVCLLVKSLYGLKQAPRLWYNKLDSVLCKFGLKNCAADRCIYIRRTTEEFTIVIAHVDDSFAASNNKTVLQEIGTHLGNNFKINSVPPTRYIGLNILRDRTTNRIFLSQSHMIEKISQRFGMSNLFPKTVPADPTIHLTTNHQPKSEGEKTASPYPYKEAVGALLYLALMSRPDISYAVGQVSRYCQNPNQHHWKAVTQIFAYLNGTMDYGIWLGGNRNGLTGYTDADFAGDRNDYRSTSGGIFFFNGGPVSWFSKKQPCTALSTTESEYIAACEATKTIVWLSCLLEDFTGVEQQKIPLYCDNQGAVRLAYNAEFHQRTKHVLVKYHYIRQKISEGKINLMYVPSDDQLADIFTKALTGPKFTMLRQKIGVGQKPL